MLVAGDTIDERYRLISLIGEGGMASVWRAEDYNLKRAVAIKLLYFGPQREPGSAVEQFLREARIAAAVQHRNVIHTMDFGTTSEGVPYMVMELLQGETLASRMQREPQLRVDEWIRIAEMTLRGLAAVHEAGIVHRDLKPQNIFLQRDADAMYPKILDFGISRSLGADKLASPITTQAGFVLGTPHYMAPEQASGEGHIDQRADIYSVGTILYEGLSGRLPFDAETTMDLLRKILSTDPTPLRELCPVSVEMIADCVSQAMARDREQRFSDARAFRSALTRAFELSYPTSVSVNRSELPMSPIEASDLPKLAGRMRDAQPQNDAARPAWGDFEGLATRQASGAGGTAALPSPVIANRTPSGPVVERSATGPVGEPVSPRARADSGPRAPQRAASGPIKPRAPSGPLSPGRAPSGPLAPNRAPSGPLYRDSPAVAAPRRASTQQQEAVNPSIPDAAISYPGEGPLLGDNPLDAFAGSAAVALELDFAPWQDRQADEGDPKERQKNPVQQAVAPVAPPQHSPSPVVQQAAAAPVRAASVSRPSAAWWWLLPGVLAILFTLFLLLPGLFSMAPPDQSEARAREADAAATRGSTRVLQLRQTPSPAGLRPEQRELLE